MRKTLSYYESNLPGNILCDIEFFLKFIQEKNFEISGGKGLLPNHCLPLINTNMSHPLKLALKREQQMSYPHISGLYLLCRALGLIKITQIKSKRYLMTDEKTLYAWSQLNATEKYFSLMHTWFFKSDEGLINKGKSSYFRDTFSTVLRFMCGLLKNKVIFKNERDQMWKLYSIKTFNLGLLEMFGMVTIEDNEGVSEKTWSIANITVTDFGRKWVDLFYDDENSFMIRMIQDEAEASLIFYKRLKEFFPKWNTILLPDIKIADNGAHFLKIYLSKKIWRRINIQGSESMACLAGCILDAFDFADDHMYEFTYTDRFGVLQKVHHYYADESPYAGEVEIGSLDILIGDTIKFLFDFGDCWKFDIQLEKIDSTLKIKKPTLLESVGEAPEQYPDYEYS